MFDIIIKNGMVVDGTGSPMFKADVGIKDNEIKAIGELHDEKGELEIGAKGLLVCPGFIDVNNHSDTYWRIFSNPDLESLVYQGITTIVGGNCGTSLAPLADARTIESIRKWTDLERVTVNWLKFKEFLDFLENKEFSVNFATLVGHATLRRGILKDEARTLAPKELNFVKKMLIDSMKNGALGLSTGLIYTHAKLAPKEELVDLAKIVQKYKGVYTSHIRGEKEELVEAVEEAIDVARKSKVKLHISHLKAMGESNWPKMEDALALIERAKETGMNITFDAYPYTNTGSVLYTLLPDWVSEGGKAVMINRLKDPVVRAKVISEMKESGFDYDKVEIAISPLNKTLARRKIAEIAASRGKSVEDAVIDILIASEGRVITSMEILSEENVRRAVCHPLSIVSTNGAGYNIFHANTRENVHQRSFGTFPKMFSRYVRKEKAMSWEEAVRKITSFPAEKFGLKKRGRIERGYFADIAVIDQGKIEGPATKDNPYRYSKGVEYLLVNGGVVLEKGEYAGTRKGRVLRK